MNFVASLGLESRHFWYIHYAKLALRETHVVEWLSVWAPRDTREGTYLFAHVTLEGKNTLYQHKQMHPVIRLQMPFL